MWVALGGSLPTEATADGAAAVVAAAFVVVEFVGLVDLRFAHCCDDIDDWPPLECLHRWSAEGHENCYCKHERDGYCCCSYESDYWPEMGAAMGGVGERPALDWH